MNHNYKLGDLKKAKCEPDIDLTSVNVVICLNNMEIPSTLVMRLEVIINNLIEECEFENGITIPLEDMELEDYLIVDTDLGELQVEVFIGYDAVNESLHSREVIKSTDDDYSIIKKFFLDKLNDYVSKQVRRIEECI